MNLRTTILRGAFATFALALFASLQAQTITFAADSWPGEMTSCIVTFDGDTVFNVSDNTVLWPGGANTTSDFSIATYGAGDYTVTMNDTYGDGGSGFSVDGGTLNCTGQCSGAVASCGFGTTCVETWAFSLISDTPGCTDPAALNYDETATLDDGSCVFDQCPGDDIMVFFEMNDSWGDGWNGNTYEVFANGNLIASGTLDSSYTETGGSGGGPTFGVDVICLPNNVCMEVVSGGGGFLGEISWTMINAYTGIPIAADGGGGSVEFYFGDTAETCGCTDATALNFDGNATVDDGSCVYPSCPTGETLVQFVMYDTFGDGWDGTTYTLSNASGDIVASGSLDAAQFIVAAGEEGYDFFCLSTTECYVLELSGGAYPGEKEWQIIDYNTGEILYNQTNNDGFGVFGVAGPGVVCGCTDSTAFNYDADATGDDGSCFLPSCDVTGGSDSTTYILYLNHDIYLYWGNNAAFIYEANGDTILSAGYTGGLYTPDYETSPVDAYYEFCVPSDACLQFSGGGGSPAGLPTWQIMDWSGNVLHEGGLGVYDIGFGASADNCESGCTLTAAINYNPDATIDDGSCVVCDNGELGFYLTLQDDFGTGWSPGNDYYLVNEDGDTVLTGTMDPGPTTTDVINCLEIGCYTFSTGAIFTTEGWAIADNLGNEYAGLTYGPTDGFPVAFGGTDVTDCAFPGCTDPDANNYNLSASVDDGSCQYPPDNDTPATAQAIACDLILTGTLANANPDEYSNTQILGNPLTGNGAIWYEFNADQDYQVTFSTCASADVDNGVTDTDVVVFVENTDGSLTAIATNDDSGVAGCGAGTTGTFNSIVSINAEQGNNYFVRVSTYSGTTTQTGIVIEATCASCPDGFPNNDDLCTLALPLVDGGSYTGSLCCSGPDEDFDMGSLSFFATAYGVWYQIETTADFNLYNITVDATGDGAVGYAIYSGADCTSLEDISSGVVSGAIQEEMNQWFAAEQEGPVTEGLSQPSDDLNYYLFIWTTQTDECGPFSISMTAEVQGCTDPTASNYNPDATVNSGCLYIGVTQPNDSCDNAVALACGDMVSGNTGGATSVGGDTPCGGSGSGVWYTLANGGVEQLVTISTCGSNTEAIFDVFQEVDAPDATLEVNSLNADNFQNISAVIVYEGDTVATIAAGDLFPTLFNDFYYALEGGDYTVYFTNEGDELDGIAAQVISSDGSSQDLLCSGGCSTAPTVCLDLTIISDNYPGETSFDLVDANGNVAWSGGIDLGFNSLSACVAPGDYTFTMYDSFGDGMCCTYGSGSYSLSGPDGVLASGGEFGDSESTSFSLEASPFNLPAGATYEQSFTIFGGTGTCNSLLCWTEGNNTLVSNEACDGGETFQFISDENANNYAILVAAGSANPLGGPFELSVSCEPVVYGCQDAQACNYNADANVDDPNDPCDFTSCLDCDTETWSYCYDNNESWSFTLNGGETIVIDLAGTAIEQGWDELVIDDAATGANLYNSDVDADDSLVIGADSVTVSFTSDASVSCASGSAYFISLAITCAPAPTTGCADSTACNYDGPVDFADNSTCDFSCLGCTNSDAVNYNPFASVDDGSCCFGAFISFNMFDSFGDGWNGATYSFYDGAGDLLATGDLLSNENDGEFDTDDICFDAAGCYTLIVTDGSFPGEVSWTISGTEFGGGPGTYQIGVGTDCTEGCGLPFAPNYVDPDSVDVVNNDLCDFTGYVMGCTYPEAENYDETATNDDGSCTFVIADDCPWDFNNDGQMTTSDLLVFLGVFGTECPE